MYVIVVSILIVLAAIAALVSVGMLNRRKSSKKDAELRFRDELFSVLANSTNDIYLVINSDGYTVEYVSPNIERILGVTADEVKADLYSFQTPVYLDGTLPTREELLAVPLGGSTSRESRRTHKQTGEALIFQETTYHMLIEGIDRLVAVLSDRTNDRKQRSALEEALASAKSANEAKTTFLSNVSHDIRTPMNAIVGLAELINQHADDPASIRKYAEQISASSHHLLGLISDVLDMSKIENGSTILNSENFSLSEIVNELDRVIRPQAESKQQSFTIEVQRDVPDVFLGDKLRITQVFMNILSNAVKYTPQGGTIDFDISRSRKDSLGSDIANLRFVVADNGIGMSKEFMDCIFDPFTREREGVFNEMQGTGLGMTIANSLVELMGGSISVISELGKGSTFTVDLPLCVQESVLDIKDASVYLDIAGMNFLIAEDIEINAEVLRELLNTRDATCEIAENGKVAAELFLSMPEGTFDAILMDVQMPVMNGYEATKAIRSSDRKDAATIPIIAMTANAFVEDVNEAIAAGMNAHLAKPATMAQLCETLGAIMTDDTPSAFFD